MFAELKNGRLVEAPDIMEFEDITVINPDEEMLKEYGFKEVEKTPRPPYEEGFSFQSHYEETEDKIVQVWDKVENPPEPVYEPVPTLEEQLEDILTGRSELA